MTYFLHFDAIFGVIAPILLEEKINFPENITE